MSRMPLAEEASMRARRLPRFRGAMVAAAGRPFSDIRAEAMRTHRHGANSMFERGKNGDARIFKMAMRVFAPTKKAERESERRLRSHSVGRKIGAEIRGIRFAAGATHTAQPPPPPWRRPLGKDWG